MSQQAGAMPIDPIEESRMTLMEHLVELRTRLMWIVGGLIVGTAIALTFFQQTIAFILDTALSMNLEIINNDPTGNISVIFKVSFTIGTAIALPIILFQIIAFMAPGLYPSEKRTLLMTLPAAIILFCIGASFSYYYLLPVAVRFLGTLLDELIIPQWTADKYISFVTRLTFWIGVAFEMPLIFAFLSRTGLVSGQMLLKYWRHAIVVMAILAAIITPTVDPVNMAIVMGPLLILYALSVGLAFMLYKPRALRDFSQESFIPDEYK